VAEAVDDPGTDVRFSDLGSYRLRDIPDPWTLFQLCAPGLEEHFPPLRGAVREGGSLVTVWRREPRPGHGDGWQAQEFAMRCLADDVDVELGRASEGHAGVFRLVVRVGGAVEEEYDGLTVGGPTDAAAVVNAHSRLLRIDEPSAE
jgi:hypothetical protein